MKILLSIIAIFTVLIFILLVDFFVEIYKEIRTIRQILSSDRMNDEDF